MELEMLCVGFALGVAYQVLFLLGSHWLFTRNSHRTEASDGEEE